MANSKQVKRINMLAYPEVIWNLVLAPPQYAYYDEVSIGDVPFPTNPWYDGKAWKWLIDHIEELPQPLAFWNIGV